MSFIKYVESAVDLGESPITDIFRPRWEKTAGMSIFMPEKIAAFMKTAEPTKGQRLLLVHGLGGDPWGANRNGDIFPEMWKGAKNLIEDDPSKPWGFHTFTKNAYTFRDHHNQDPKFTIGGKVVCAAWNDKMHRVELIIPVSERLAPDVVEAIDGNEKIAVSMGAKVPYDVCTRCSNKAKHRGEYCKHAKLLMGHVDSDGVKYAVYNPKPNFFDISVLGNRGQGRPADPSAYSLAKVAMVNGFSFDENRGGYIRMDLRKKADKQADMLKEVPAVGQDAENAEHEHDEMPCPPGMEPHTSHETDEHPMLGGSEDEASGDKAATIEKLFELIKKLLPHDMMNQMPMDGQITMRISKEGADAALPTLLAAGIILSPVEFDKVGWVSMPPRIDVRQFSPALFDSLKVAMHQKSQWLSFFGDRIYRVATKTAAERATSEPLPSGSLAYYGRYIDLVKTALGADRSSLLKLIERNPSIMHTLFRGESYPEMATKVANNMKGLSGGNLMAAFLGPLILSAYFRSKQMDPHGSGVGPVQGLVANHPLATGAATALLWHKLKGGKVPLVG